MHDTPDMKPLIPILDDLGVSPFVQGFVSGRFHDLICDDYSLWRVTVEDARFPPAFIPFNGSTGICEGIWRHWFVDRPYSYVKFYPHDSVLAEVARTDSQFLSLRLGKYSDLMAEPRSLDSLCKIGRQLGIPDVDCETYFNALGGEAPYYLLSAFQAQLPRDRTHYYRREDDWSLSTYDGWFPTKHWPLGHVRWRSCCRIEAKYEDQSDFEDFQDLDLVPQFGVDPPSWFGLKDPVGYFHEALKQMNFREAWLTLNSAYGDPEFGPQQANLLRKLEHAVSDAGFSRYLGLWRSLTAFL